MMSHQSKTEVIRSAQAIQSQAGAIVSAVGNNELDGLRARLNLIKQSVAMIEGELVMAGKP